MVCSISQIPIQSNLPPKICSDNPPAARKEFISLCAKYDIEVPDTSFPPQPTFGMGPRDGTATYWPQPTGTERSMLTPGTTAQESTSNTATQDPTESAGERPTPNPTGTPLSLGQTPEPTTSGSSSPNAKSSGSSPALAVGLGVGLPIFFIAVGVLIFFLLKRRKQSPAAADDGFVEQTIGVAGGDDKGYYKAQEVVGGLEGGPGVAEVANTEVGRGPAELGN